MSSQDTNQKHKQTFYSAHLNELMKRINQARGPGEKKYTQYQLAKESGVSQPTVSRILSGESKQPSAESFRKLTGVLVALFYRTLPREEIQSVSPIAHFASIVEASETSIGEVMSETTESVEESAVVVSTTYEIDQELLVKALDILEEDVGDWYSNKSSNNIARLITMAYDRAQKEEK